MARLAPSYPEIGNALECAPDALFVKQTSIDCDLCRQTAPFAFARKHVGNTRQRLALEEERLPREEFESCRPQAIGYKLA